MSKSEVPQQLIDEYERGMETVQETIRDSRYGVVTHTLVTQSLGKEASAAASKNCTIPDLSHRYAYHYNPRIV